MNDNFNHMKSLITLIFIFIPLMMNSGAARGRSNQYIGIDAIFSLPQGQPAVISNTLDLTNMASRSVDLMPSLILLFLGAVIIAAEVYLASIDVILSEHLFKCILVSLVIISSMILITVCYSNNQLTGITAISGIAAVYLLAKAKFPGDSSINLLKDKKNI